MTEPVPSDDELAHVAMVARQYVDHARDVTDAPLSVNIQFSESGFQAFRISVREEGKSAAETRRWNYEGTPAELERGLID